MACLTRATCTAWAGEPRVTEPGQAAGTGLAGPGPALRPAGFSSRYAGAMLLHAFFARTAAGAVLAGAAAGPQDVALLTAVSMCLAPGAATAGQFKHLAAAEAGPLAGLSALPGLRALRPELARIADAADPLRLQTLFAAAMLAADPVTSGVYYVDDHFVPYTGAKPVAKGWNNKRGRAERGRADTHVTAHDGRAVCFVSGEPSGLSTTLPLALAELKKAAGPGAGIMLGFDRGGAYPPATRPAPPSGTRRRPWPPLNAASPSCSGTPVSAPRPRTTASRASRRTSPGPAPRRPPPSRPASRSPPNCPPAPSTRTREPRCCAPGAAACR